MRDRRESCMNTGQTPRTAQPVNGDAEAQLQETLPATLATPATPQAQSSESSKSSRGTPLTVRYATSGEGNGPHHVASKSAACAPQEGQESMRSDGEEAWRD